MLGKKMESALNKQINAEIYSAYLYLSMAAWSDSQGLDGFGDHGHGLYMIDRELAARVFTPPAAEGE